MARLLWASYIEAEQNTAYGRSSSPILVAGKLIVHMTNLYAFDLATAASACGSTAMRPRPMAPRWRSASMATAWSSPHSGGDVVRSRTARASTAASG
jgi:hypothetical protein